MIIASASADDRIRLIAIEMKGAFGNEGALRFFSCSASDWLTWRLSEHVVETREQMGNGFFGLIAHIRKAEGLAFDLAVAGVDDEVVFFAQVFRQLGHVDTKTVPDASEAL